MVVRVFSNLADSSLHFCVSVSRADRSFSLRSVQAKWSVMNR